jgi:signal peptidase I
MLCLALLAFAVKPFVAEAIVVSTPSMSPTINPGERVVADKWTTPHRWDLVLYRRPGANSALYCKRLVALPGERIRFESGTLYINDKPQIPPTVLAGKFNAGYPSSPSRSRYADGQTIVLGPDEYFLIGDNVGLSLDSRADGPSGRADIVGVVDAICWPPDRARIFH